MRVLITSDLCRGQRMDDVKPYSSVDTVLAMSDFEIGDSVRVEIEGAHATSNMLKKNIEEFMRPGDDTIRIMLYYREALFFGFHEFEVYSQMEAERVLKAFSVAETKYTMEYGIRDDKQFWHFKR